MKRNELVPAVGMGLLVMAVAPARAQFGAYISLPAPLNNTADTDTGIDIGVQIASDRMGNWVAVWRSSEPNIGSGIGMDTDILVARSTDNGMTWTDPAPLNNNAGTDTGFDGDPHIVTDGHGNWLAVWVSAEPNIGGGIGMDGDIVAARSTDNGATWTDPAPVNSTAAGDTGGDFDARVATDGQGNVVVVWTSQEPNISGGIGMDEDILVARSTDNGATWTDAAVLNDYADTDMGGDYMRSLATDGEGNWIAVWTSVEPNIAGGIGMDYDVIFARSTDGGATWSAAAPLNNNAGSDPGSDFRPQIAADTLGNWLVVWTTDTDNIGGGIGMDFDIAIARSTDGGATWTDPAPLDTHAGSDMGDDDEADIVADGAGLWMAVWRTDEPNVDAGVDIDADILIARSTDSGATWTVPVPLNSGAGSDTGDDKRPDIATDGRGNWIGAWESAEPIIAGGVDTDFDILFVPFALPDRNFNGIGDAQDIADGASEDCNANSVPDEIEADSDNDGLIDACDGCPDDPDKTSPGTCGCGESDADADGDGLPDCLDVPTTQPSTDCIGGLLSMIPVMLLGCTVMRRKRA